MRRVLECLIYFPEPVRHSPQRYGLIKISVTLLSDSLDEMGGRRCYRNMDRQLGVYFLLSRFDVVQLSAVLHRLPDRSRYAFLSVLMTISFMVTSLSQN